MCSAVTVEHEHDKQNDIIVDSETDNEADNCSDQRDGKKVFDLEKTHGMYLCYHMHIATYDNGDNNLSTSTVFDFHVGNIESNCEQLEEFENEADSDKEGKLTTSESHSKVINQSN